MTFSEWLLGKVRASGLSNSEIARRGGISHARISQVLAGEAPGVEFCNAIARGLQIPPEEVLRMAGLLPPVPAAVEEEREMLGLYRRLDGPVRRGLLETMRSLLGIRAAPVLAEDTASYEPRTLSERLAYEIAKEYETLPPDDQAAVRRLMEGLRGDRRGAMQPDETPLSGG